MTYRSGCSTILAFAFAAAVVTASEVRQTRSISAPEAIQAAAVDGRVVYAIGSVVIAKYDRNTGERIALSTGAATHLNSGFVHDGKLYCAHSNYPKKPEQSEIKVLDPESMRISVFKDFGESNGSLTWAVREGDAWWCTFAFYGDDNARTRLVKFDDQWREQRVWTFPMEVVKDLGRNSISGGIWRGGQLWVTGHDHRVIYQLRVPEKGGVLELINVLPSPFPGQGIAMDPKSGGLVGIDRGKKQIVFAEVRE